MKYAITNDPFFDDRSFTNTVDNKDSYKNNHYNDCLGTEVDEVVKCFSISTDCDDGVCDRVLKIDNHYNDCTGTRG